MLLFVNSHLAAKKRRKKNEIQMDLEGILIIEKIHQIYQKYITKTLHLNCIQISDNYRERERERERELH